ncbi:MAG: prepilin-type N-terminal cleavage/methylation domain-containing protein [Planctomycetota bacterium]
MIVTGVTLRAGRRQTADGRSPAATGRGARRPRSASRRPNSAFTLVELLVAIAIIAILATLLVGVGAVAAESARVARTKSLVARLHTLVMERYEAYRTRRPSGAPRIRLADVNNTGNVGAVRAAQRLHVVRTLMRMEMPDRWSDILNEPVAALPPNSTLDPHPFFVPRVNETPTATRTEDATKVILPRTPLCEAYLRRYSAIDPTVSAEIIERNQSAECLYLIVMLSTGDGEATSLFKESDIGDTDGDGAPEFLDGWGNPIAFVRWPKGHDGESDLQNDDDEAWLNDHDPLDVFRLHTPDYVATGTPETAELATRLVPLVFSAGPDEEYGVVGAEREGDASLVDQLSNLNRGMVQLGFTAAGGVDTQWVLDPYSGVGQGTTATGGTVPLRLGRVWSPVDELLRPAEEGNGSEPWVDNVTNHQLARLSARDG